MLVLVRRFMWMSAMVKSDGLALRRKVKNASTLVVSTTEEE
jgi:hypothetical protein